MCILVVFHISVGLDGLLVVVHDIIVIIIDGSHHVADVVNVVSCHYIERGGHFYVVVKASGLYLGGILSSFKLINDFN